MPDKPPSPAALLQRHGLHAKKALGQCFLHDRGVVRRIVEAAGIQPHHTVVEIGPGLGIRTEALATAAGRVHAVERDRDMVAVLRQRLPDVELLQQDALELDLSRFAAPLQVLGNLPYNITSPLLFHLLQQRRQVEAMTLMVQREVAQRLCAAPGSSKAYGAPSVICQRLARVKLCFAVGRGAFFPVPGVDSAVVQLRIRETPLVQLDDALFARVVRAAFNFRRKTLRKALSSTFDRELVAQALERSGIDGQRRGETLNVQEFGALALALGAHDWSQVD